MTQLQRCGIISRPMGLKGDFLIETENYTTLFSANEQIYIGYSPTFTDTYTVVQSKYHGKHIQVVCQTVTTKEKAELLVGKAVYVDARKQSGTYKEEYLVQEVIGCQAIDYKTKSTIGTITDVWQLPANDVWVVTTSENKEVLVAVIDSTIQKVNVKERYIELTLMEEIDGDE